MMGVGEEGKADRHETKTPLRGAVKIVENNSVGNRGPKYAAFFPPLTSLLRYGDMESADADWHEYMTLDPEVRTVFGKLSRFPSIRFTIEYFRTISRFRVTALAKPPFAEDSES
jgi:hypothetical protein